MRNSDPSTRRRGFVLKRGKIEGSVAATAIFATSLAVAMPIAGCALLGNCQSLESDLRQIEGDLGISSAAAAESLATSPQRYAAAGLRDGDVRGFLAALYPQAARRGIDRATFERAFHGLTLDPAVARASTRQSEFARPFSAYFNDAVAPRRIAQGRRLAAQWHSQLAEISRRFGVPGPILLAAWAMESDFGRDMGGKDIIRSLATLAFLRPDRELFRNELLDALVILQKGAVLRGQMTGSWAGAMGGPQFLPSTYLAHAVSYTGGTQPNIWTNAPDILASIADFLAASGWKRGARWGMEVTPPAHFNYASLHGDFRQWAALGFRPAAGGMLPRTGAATLFFPAGAKGPAFLLGDNYWVIKAYNNSDAYALSLGCLADRIAGAPGLRRSWPKGEKLWQRSERAEIQRLLQRLGLYKGLIDGRFGPSSRDAIHAFQIAVAEQPADGVGGADLLARLRKQAGE